jgi:hypothetical protein
VSVIENPSPERVKTARLAVFTRPPERDIALDDDCVVLGEATANVSGGRHVVRVDAELAEPYLRDLRAIPAGFDLAIIGSPIIGEALRRGGIRKTDVTLRGVEMAGG